jgi:hypothetical protein
MQIPYARVQGIYLMISHSCRDFDLTSRELFHASAGPENTGPDGSNVPSGISGVITRRRAAAKLLESASVTEFSLRKLAKAMGVDPTKNPFPFEGRRSRHLCHDRREGAGWSSPAV